MPNKVMYIGFSTHRGFNIPSFLIRLFEHTPYSHVYVRIPSESLDRQLIYEASGLKVHFNNLNNFIQHSKIIKEFRLEISDETKKKTLQFAIDNLEKDYSLKQLIGMIWVRTGKLFGKKWKNPFPSGRSAYICSELVAAILEEIGFKIEEDLDSIDPKDVYELMERNENGESSV